ncbi:extracellular solute-binding protein [Paenibacillus lemnae]|uniref:Extracellular solute-binding protein n=1 Tax=Paenibacillus lemnae TaxID=1330551 RepID=A0A848M711_PAELE|nr:extracellular solute-binding protein [Paenibacillus lemnae]NMO96001.1 extracellular solute-binding protein [Paenibacillus lemnae]
MAENKPQRSTFHKRLEYMVDTLRKHIVTGKYGIGDLLPSNSELGQIYGLSKNSVRKGLDILSEEKLITRLPKVGAKVANPQNRDMLTITLGCYNNMVREARLNEILNAFHIRYPHIKVQTLILPYDPYFKTVQEYIDNDWLDVMMINHSDFDFFQDETGSQLLDELVPIPGIYKCIAEAFTYENRLLAVPFMFSPIILGYNKTHFAQSHLAEPNSSWTWDDLRQAAARLNEDHGSFGFYYHMQSSNRWPVMLLQNGFRSGEAGNNSKSAKERFIDSIELCRNLVVNQPYSPLHFSESNSDVEELFMRGKVSMILCTYYSLNKMKNGEIDYDIAPLPMIHEPKTLLLTTGLAINSKSKEKNAARLLLDFMLSTEAQMIIRKQTLSIPSLERAAEWTGEEVMKRPSRYHMYREIIPTFRFMRDLNLHNRDMITIRKELKLFWAGMEDADSVWDRLQPILESGYRSER